MTFAEFEELPNQGLRQELRHGEVVNLAPPKHGHRLIQRRLRQLLEVHSRNFGEVDLECGFRPVNEFEFRMVDVAVVSTVRWDAIPVDSYLDGAPELVIEVISPSNTAGEIADKQNLCLPNGTLEFWVIHPKRRDVKVTKQGGEVKTYRSGQQIPLFFGGSIAVDAIFA
jgi:Uma2 family endonuclease